MTRTWQDNADECRHLDEGEGWPFARLVACSVANEGQGRGKVSRGTLKATATEFAERWGTSPARVLRYLNGWRAAAKAGLVADPDQLTPDDVGESFPTEPEYSWLTEKGALRFHDGKNKPTGGRPRDADPAVVTQIIDKRGADKVVEVMPHATRQAVVKATIKDVAQAIIEQPDYVSNLLTQMTDDQRRTLSDAVEEASTPGLAESRTRIAANTHQPTPRPVNLLRRWENEILQALQRGTLDHEHVRFSLRRIEAWCLSLEMGLPIEEPTDQEMTA